MQESGINDPTALRHDVHVWPMKKATRVRTQLLRFQNGHTFYGVGDSRISIHDIPKGATVVIHADATARFKLIVA